MTATKSLPVRPSLDSLRKQAKRLARDVAAGDASATARAEAHLSPLPRPLSRRNALLVVAREYGFAGWRDLAAEVSSRLDRELEWAAKQALVAIHDSSLEQLRSLLDEHPALLSWRDSDHEEGLLGAATASFGDSFDPARAQVFTRTACADLLVEAGAQVTPSIFDNLIASRAVGLLELLQRKGLLPRTLRFLSALGDLDRVRVALRGEQPSLAATNEAFLCACRFEQAAAAALLLERCVALDPDLAQRLARRADRVALIRYLSAERSLDFMHAAPTGPWQAFVMEQVARSIRDGNLKSFVSSLRAEPWLLGEEHAGFRCGIIERATLLDREEFITTLLALWPSLQWRQRLSSQAIEFALTYAKPHLLPTLTRIWPLADDLPHAAAVGDLARVERWFDASGAPALGTLDRHFPCNSQRPRSNLRWGAPSSQQVLDTALAWSVVNRHFEVADFLLAHGADINCSWSSHEPASILHELVLQGNYESMRFLIDRGIDMTIRDYRWNSTAQGWALHAVKNPELASWLEEAERRREPSEGGVPRAPV